MCKNDENQSIKIIECHKDDNTESINKINKLTREEIYNEAWIRG